MNTDNDDQNYDMLKVSTYIVTACGCWTDSNYKLYLKQNILKQH